MDGIAALRDLRRAGLRGAIVDPDHPEYDGARRVWNATADRRPAVVVRAACTPDVEKVVAIAAEHGALLAVRGGGHSIPGLSTCDGGIVVDLSRMNGIALDRQAGLVTVSGGALLGDLDRACVPQGFVVPAGIVSHTGVGGLTLGGGMGWLSRRFGLTIDSLRAADIVTADGRSRRIDLDREPDLFWAIRGGGGNFGVVTSFVFTLHSLGQVAIGVWTYPASAVGAVLRRYREAILDAPRELTTAVTYSSESLRVTAIWSGATNRAERALAAIGKLGHFVDASVGKMTYLDLQSRSDADMCWNRRYYARGCFLREIDEATIATLEEYVPRAPTPGGGVYILHLGGAVSDVEDHATAYTGRAAGHYCLVDTGWDDAGEDAQQLSWSRMTASYLARLSMRGNYVNEQGDAGTEVARAAYGDLKYARLGRIKAAYDPANLFRLNQNIEPKA